MVTPGVIRAKLHAHPSRLQNRNKSAQRLLWPPAGVLVRTLSTLFYDLLPPLLPPSVTPVPFSTLASTATSMEMIYTGSVDTRRKVRARVKLHHHLNSHRHNCLPPTPASSPPPGTPPVRSSTSPSPPILVTSPTPPPTPPTPPPTPPPVQPEAAPVSKSPSPPKPKPKHQYPSKQPTKPPAASPTSKRKSKSQSSSSEPTPQSRSSSQQPAPPPTAPPSSSIKKRTSRSRSRSRSKKPQPPSGSVILGAHASTFTPFEKTTPTSSCRIPIVSKTHVSRRRHRHHLSVHQKLHGNALPYMRGVLSSPRSSSLQYS